MQLTFTFLTVSLVLCDTKACSVSMDVVIALDASGSIGYSNFTSCLEFAKDIVSSFETDTGKVRVGMMTFDDTSNIIFHLNAYVKKTDIRMAIGNAAYTNGGTDTKQALEIIVERMFVEKNGDRPDIKNILFLITDGVSDSDPISAAETAQERGIAVMILGVGQSIYRLQLKGMASKPTRKHLFQKNLFLELADYGSTISSKICQVAEKPPSCSKGEVCKFPLKRGYMMPFQKKTHTTGLRSLTDCISWCIIHFKVTLGCQAFNFCKPDNKLIGTCQIAFLIEEWEGKHVANSTCVFGTAPNADV